MQGLCQRRGRLVSASGGSAQHVARFATNKHALPRLLQQSICALARATLRGKPKSTMAAAQGLIQQNANGTLKVDFHEVKRGLHAAVQAMAGCRRRPRRHRCPPHAQPSTRPALFPPGCVHA